MYGGCIPAGAATTAAASGPDSSTAAVAADVDLIWQEENVSMVGTCIQPLLVVPTFRLLACVADLHYCPLRNIALSADYAHQS